MKKTEKIDIDILIISGNKENNTMLSIIITSGHATIMRKWNQFS